MSNYKLLNILGLVWDVNVVVYGVLGELVQRFLDLVNIGLLDNIYVNQPVFYAIFENTLLLLNPFNVFDP